MVNKNYIKTLVNGLLKKIESHHSDWNINDENVEGYVKNRTHWTENNVKNYWVKDKTIQFAALGTEEPWSLYYEGQEPLSLNGENFLNATITIVWDGTKYDCSFVRAGDFVFIGNIKIHPDIVNNEITDERIESIIGRPITNEPFLILWTNITTQTIITKSTAATHTISISTISDVIHKLDNKYMSKEVDAHITDEKIHISEDDRNYWDEGNANINHHVTNDIVHVTSSDKTKWNNGSSNNVKFTTQSLTDANKLQARKNIGANKTYQKITLYSSSWDSSTKQQTVTVTGVLADETKQEITPMPAIASQSAYYEAGIMCTNQAANKLTFTADEIPTTSLTVYVTIQGVDAV